MLFCSDASTTSSIQLSDWADIAQVIIAIANIGWAVYIFGNQQKKDTEKEYNAAVLHEQSIKLQWFKELIIQPNLEKVFRFYDKLEELKDRIVDDNLSDEQIIQINRYINDCAGTFRKEFIVVIASVNKPLHTTIQTDIDELVTKLTEAVSNDEHKLTNHKTFAKYISDPINNSKSNLLSTIYNFKGI